MNWSMAGQVLTVWGMAAFLAAPLIGRYLRKRRIRNEMLAVVRAEADRRRDRLEATYHVANAELDRRRMSKEAATPITDTKWQERARRAEALGFIEEEESGPWVA